MRPIATIFIVSALVFLSQTAMAQQKQIALHHQGEVSMFTSLTDAYNAAVNGDTLYLPGGSTPSIHMQKSLVLFGAGHNPETASATSPTVLNSLHIYSGADGSIISGIKITNIVSVYSSTAGIKISRCFLNSGIFFEAGNYSNWVFNENYVGQGNAYGHLGSIFSFYASLEYFQVSNNLIADRLYSWAALSLFDVSNNIFPGNGNVQGNNLTIRNNIFYHTNIYTSSTQWYNNINAGVNGGPDANFNTGSGNFLDYINLESIFVNFSHGNTFYQNDFHVVNPAYIGNDGAPIGIYGGPFPWKEGSLPPNPHISSKVISSVTNPDGTLHINVEVNAQQH